MASPSETYFSTLTDTTFNIALFSISIAFLLGFKIAFTSDPGGLTKFFSGNFV